MHRIFLEDHVTRAEEIKLAWGLVVLALAMPVA